MLIFLAATALCGFVAALLLGWQFPLLLPAVHVHAALAVGVMPLILGAMLHFMPVLTRSGTPAKVFRFLPLLAQIGGVTVTLAFAFPVFLMMGRHLATTLALLAGIALFGWGWRRGRLALGAPHPGLHWYLAALACLVLALLAAVAMSLWPEQYPAFKRLHLHLNVLGLIGLTAVGTLQVLLPTATGRPDAQVAGRLRQGLPYAFSSVVLIAVGAAWIPWLAWLGAVLWVFPLHRLLAAWWAQDRADIFAWHGAAPSLAAALGGFGLSLALGGLHAAGLMRADDVAHAFILTFLLPLVTGALTQLLPIWLHPGVQTPARAALRERLGRWSGARALLFLCGGLAVAGGGRTGLMLAALGLALFIWQLLAALTNLARIQVE